MNKNIILIGFMGVGKGRSARALSEKSGWFTVDTDDLIETMVKMKIRNIFAERGEPYFRELEQQTANWLRKNVKRTIVSTGGGFFQVNKINQLGKVIYLHSSVDGIIKSILKHPDADKKIKKRPLLQNLEQAKELFARRLPLYRLAADLEIVVEGREPEDIAEELLELIK